VPAECFGCLGGGIRSAVSMRRRSARRENRGSESISYTRKYREIAFVQQRVVLNHATTVSHQLKLGISLSRTFFLLACE